MTAIDLHRHHALTQSIELVSQCERMLGDAGEECALLVNLSLAALGVAMHLTASQTGEPGEAARRLGLARRKTRECAALLMLVCETSDDGPPPGANACRMTVVRILRALIRVGACLEEKTREAA